MTLGRSIYRLDAPGKVTGATLYPADLTPGALLHAKVVFSGRPHARMRRIDLSRALAAPGVVAIFTAKDVPVNEYGLVIKDQPVLVGLDNPMPGSDVSRWEGDQVAFVVAESEEAAEAARALIDIEWDELPVLDDPRRAMHATTLLHPQNGNNILRHYRIRKGDMAAGWAAADVIVEGDYYVPRQEHAYLQPEAGLGYIDEAGRITVEVAGQWTHEDLWQITHALNLPDDRVRVKYAAIGGAFGGREDMSIQIVLALAAWKLAEKGEYRPIRVIWTREESIIGHHKRHEGHIHARWGATHDGLLTAVEAEVIFDAGAYNYTSNKVLGNAHVTVCGPYRIPNAHVDSYAVYTNNVPGGAFRGFGAPQGCFVAESQMNKLAAALGIDPVELRLKNVLHDDDLTVLQTPLPAGVSLEKVIRRCVAAAGWEAPLPARAPFKSFHSLPPGEHAIRRGRGFACAFKNVGFSFAFPERSEAKIELRGSAEIERAILYYSGAEVGQGHHTAIKQMTAAALELPLDRVDLVVSDTAYTGDSGSASASRLTWMAGNAIRGAAELALAAWRAEDRPAIGDYRYVPPPTEAFDDETGRSNPNFSYGYVAEVVEAAVDIETGMVHIERVLCTVDAGKVINANLIEGQVEGGIVQAQGYAVSEDLKLKEGRILNPHLSTYLVPGIWDIPDRVETVLVEEPDPRGPWGVRGIGEMPFIPLAPALTAALYAATGVWFDSLPLTPEKVATQLQQLEG